MFWGKGKWSAEFCGCGREAGKCWLVWVWSLSFGRLTVAEGTFKLSDLDVMAGSGASNRSSSRLGRPGLQASEERVREAMAGWQAGHGKVQST